MVVSLSSERSNSEEPPEGPLPARRRSRGVWFALVGAIACALFTALAGWKYLQRPRSRLGGMQISARTMPDGTVLVLERLTTRQPHELTIVAPGRSIVSSWFGAQTPVGERKIQVDPADGAAVMWLTRWHPGLPDSLDFDWWVTSVLTDGYGEQITDRDEQSHVVSPAGGMSSRSAPRPWSPLASARGDIIVAVSRFPALRQAAEVRPIKFYDRSGMKVAEFDVPFPDTSAAPLWTPEALPAVKRHDDVQVTFSGVASTELPKLHVEGIKLRFPRPRWSVVPEFLVERNGTPAPEWKTELVRMTDALGNVAWSHDCRLSAREPAWKLELTLARTEPAAFAQDEQWESPLAALPAADSSQQMDEAATVQNVGVSLVAVGRGAVRYTEFARTRETAIHRLVGRRDLAQPYGLSHSSVSEGNGPTRHTAEISGNCAHLLLKLELLPPNHRELFVVRDDQGRHLPHSLETFTIGDTLYAFVFVAPADDAQSVGISVYVHTARVVELLMAPPSPER